jgi:hypothetical protein
MLLEERRKAAQLVLEAMLEEREASSGSAASESDADCIPFKKKRARQDMVGPDRSAAEMRREERRKAKERQETIEWRKERRRLIDLQEATESERQGAIVRQESLERWKAQREAQEGLPGGSHTTSAATKEYGGSNSLEAEKGDA